MIITKRIDKLTEKKMDLSVRKYFFQENLKSS